MDVVEVVFMTVIGVLAVALVATISYALPGNGNIDWVKDRAVETWSSQGFDVVGYEGYMYGSGWKGTSYGGARVWYRLKRKDNTSLMYSGCIARWGDEAHVYGPKLVEGSTKIDIGN